MIRRGLAERVDYELTEAEAELLASVNADALAAAGRLGGSLGGATGGGGPGALGGASGGAKGGRIGAKMTRPRTAVSAASFDIPSPEARGRAEAAISQKGQVIPDPNGGDDAALWGIVASGAMGMVPALVRVEFTDHGPTRCSVHVRATGREGLIKQGIGSKAADRIVAAIAG